MSTALLCPGVILVTRTAARTSPGTRTGQPCSIFPVLASRTHTYLMKMTNLRTA